MPAWVTNDATAARALERADAAYERAIGKAFALPLAEKVNAIRVARMERDAAYQAVTKPQTT